MRASKFLVGAVATCLIAVGVAAQTGTIHLARPARHVSTATPNGEPTVIQKLPPPQVVQPAPPAPPAPPPAAAPVRSNGDQGDGEGDGGD